MERRLAAILAADVVGYTRLMSDDEAGTLRDLIDLRQRVIEPLISEKHGRIVKLMGDGLLVEFASVVDAVDCARSWQEKIIEDQDGVNGDRSFKFRIGINLGDVIVEDDDIHGDGVNIASRLEHLAEPGGICISDDAYRQVKGKLDIDFQDLGEISLKNVPDPVRIYRFAGSTVNLDRISTTPAKLSLPDKPSIAVIPFVDINADAAQPHFADGLTEEIITMLCKVERLFVVAHSSTRAYRGNPVSARQVSQEQGVRYVLEGSVRKSGDRIRVTAQLTDAQSGYQVWADRFDRDIEDIFAVQDEITREVAVSLQVELTEGEQARIRAGGTEDFVAWDLTVRGAELVNRHVREDNERARSLLEKAVQVDPEYVDAWCQLGWCHWADARHSWSPSIQASLAKSREIGEKATALDPAAAEPWALLAMTAMQEGNFDEASDHAAESVVRAAGHSFVLAIAGMVFSYCGRPSEAVKLFERATRLSPIHPNWYRVCLSRSHFLSGDLDSTIRDLKGWSGYFDGTFAFPVYLLAALVEAGRVDEARQIAEEALRAEPDFTISAWQVPQKFKNPEDLARFVQALNSLNLPS